LSEAFIHPQHVVERTRVSGVTLHRLKHVRDPRGDLAVGNFPSEIPFVPARFFLVFGVDSKDIRGEHAHRRCAQFLVCVSGSCVVSADDGRSREELLLDRRDIGLYLPPMIWGAQYQYTADACLLVFASEPYDANEYIRGYDEFRALRDKSGNQ
jgi:dTDP-4-dehydrorhamnose 3,5-epimerase-like enzyme